MSSPVDSAISCMQGNKAIAAIDCMTDRRRAREARAIRTVAQKIAFFRTAIATVLILASAICGSCSVVGPTSITAGRTFYNEVIQKTSAEQLLLNVVRVSQSDSPQFMDVTEVDATLNVAGSVTGGAGNIGPPSGAIGTLSSTVGYSETPTVRYQTLQGYPLIQQVSLPISGDSITSLYNSNWSFSAILDLIFNKITAGYADFYPAIDTLVALDNYGTLTLAATRVPSLNEAQVKKPGTQSQGQQSQPPNNAVIVYFEPNDRFNRRLAAAAPPPRDPSISCMDKAFGETHGSAGNAEKLWKKLRSFYPPETEPTKNSLLLASVPLPLSSGKLIAPMVEMRSALGVLKQTQFGLIKVVDENTYRDIVQYNSSSPCFPKSFYFTDTTQLKDEWREMYRLLAEPAGGPGQRAGEYYLGHSRSYILIIRSENPPPNAFVSTRYRGEWYYISTEDDVSKDNFALLGQIVTIQSIPNQSQPLTASITVGGL